MNIIRDILGKKYDVIKILLLVDNAASRHGKGDELRNG
jgi:hypothetical protein